MRLSARILYTVAVLGILFLGLMWIADPFSDEAGTLELKVLDEEGDTVIDETYAFDEDDTLFTVIDQHHETVCADRSYDPDPSCEVTFGDRGRVLLGVDSVMTDWTDTFLYLEVNGDMANYGVDTVPLEDGNEYAIHVENVD